MMTEEYSQWTRIKAVFFSGKTVLVSGIYDFVCHSDTTPCYFAHVGNRIFLAEGDTFPRHGACNRKVFWHLREAFDDEEANEHSKERTE